MATYLKTFSLSENDVTQLTALQHDRQRSRTVRALFAATALLLAEDGVLIGGAGVGERQVVGVSLDSPANSIFKALKVRLRSRSSLLLSRAIRTERVRELAEGVLTMGDKERQELEQILLASLVSGDLRQSA